MRDETAETKVRTDSRTAGEHNMARTVCRNLLSLLYRPELPECFGAVPCALPENEAALKEIPWITTNFTSQWCLKTIVATHLIPGDMPDTFTRLLEYPPEYRLYGT